MTQGRTMEQRPIGADGLTYALRADLAAGSKRYGLERSPSASTVRSQCGRGYSLVHGSRKPDESSSWENLAVERVWRTLDVLARIAERHGASVPSVTIAWSLRSGSCDVALMGTTSLERGGEAEAGQRAAGPLLDELLERVLLSGERVLRRPAPGSPRFGSTRAPMRTGGACYDLGRQAT